MQRTLVFWVMPLCFILEGTLVPWLIPAIWETQVKLAPHFVLMIILFAAVYMSRMYGFAFGLMFGLLHDVVYHGHMLGIYTFSMGFTGYLAGLVFRGNRVNFVLMMIAAALGSFLFDSLVYGMYKLFNVIFMPYALAFTRTILPSVLINLLFALIIYIPVRNMIEGTSSPRKDDGKE